MTVASEQRDPREPADLVFESWIHDLIVVGFAVVAVANTSVSTAKTIGGTATVGAGFAAETASVVVAVGNTVGAAAMTAGHTGVVAAGFVAAIAAAAFVAGIADRAGIVCVAAAVPQFGGSLVGALDAVAFAVVVALRVAAVGAPGWVLLVAAAAMAVVAGWEAAAKVWGREPCSCYTDF